MRKYIKQLLSCIMTIIITVSILNVTANLVERKESDIKNKEFLEQDKDFEVLFLGTSHMINGVYPMELWDDYGIVSYNLAGHSTPIATSYWVLKNALDYTKPKVVVIDCLAIRENKKISDNFDYAHLSFDVFPLSRTKYLAVNDLMTDDIEHSKWDLLFPFSKYHNRWNQLTNADFFVEHSCEKGAEMRVDLVEPLCHEKIPADNKMVGDTVAIDYLERIIQECNKRGIEVLLTYIPFPADIPYQEEANRVYDIAEEYGVDYINFLDMDIVNYSTDCYDATSHLNPSGARKVTEYLGQYIVNNYDVKDQRTNADYAKWADDYEEYQIKKNEILIDIENPYVYMSMLTDNNYNVIIEIVNEKILYDEKLCILFENMGIDREKLMSAEYVVIDNQAGVIDYITKEQVDFSGVETTAGVFEKQWYSDTNYYIKLNENIYYDVLAEDAKWIDMRTMVIDNRNQTLVEDLYYMHMEDENIEWNTILCRVE